MLEIKIKLSNSVQISGQFVEAGNPVWVGADVVEQLKKAYPNWKVEELEKRGEGANTEVIKKAIELLTQHGYTITEPDTQPNDDMLLKIQAEVAEMDAEALDAALTAHNIKPGNLKHETKVAKLVEAMLKAQKEG